MAPGEGAGRRRQRSRLVVLLLVALLVASGCRFSIVGDSVTADARSELRARGAEVSAFGGVTIKLGRDALRILARTGRQRIIVALGRMDVSRGTDIAVIRRRMTAVLRHDVRNVRCVVWVDLPQTPNAIAGWPERAREFNRVLGVVTRSFGRPVARWSRVAARNPGWFRSDGIHMNRRGQVGYARFIQAAASRHCG